MAWPGHCIAYFTKTAPDALEFGYDVSPGVLIARSRSGGGEWRAAPGVLPPPGATPYPPHLEYGAPRGRTRGPNLTRVWARFNTGGRMWSAPCHRTEVRREPIPAEDWLAPLHAARADPHRGRINCAPVEAGEKNAPSGTPARGSAQPLTGPVAHASAAPARRRSAPASTATGPRATAPPRSAATSTALSTARQRAAAADSQRAAAESAWAAASSEPSSGSVEPGAPDAPDAPVAPDAPDAPVARPVRSTKWVPIKEGVRVEKSGDISHPEKILPPV